MIANEIRLSDLVDVDAGFKPSVQLPIDFDNSETNTRLLHTFIPTSGSIGILTEIAQSLSPNSSERARALVGTFGTGKSDLLLVICNYFSREVDDPVMLPFYDRLRQIDPARAGIIRQRRENRPPFLVVLLQGDPVSAFPGFVLHGLQRALEGVGLAHLMNNTKYQAAREQIDDWRREGHARYEDFRRALEEREERDVDGLLAALAGPQADAAMPVFLRTFKRVTGTEFNVYGYSQPHETYANVAQSLVGTGQFSGILLVVDEFTAYFERFQRAIDQQLSEIDSETKVVENIAERSSSSGAAQLHFMVASLESFAAAAGGISSGPVGKAVERVGGRFKHHSLMVQGSEELIRGAIKRLPTAEQVQLLPNAQRDDLIATAEALWGRQRMGRDWLRDVIVGGTFPLHPVTSYALPLINQRVAQSQRTMFLFLQDQQGLRGFIAREHLQEAFPDWHRLLTADLLFDYFYASIATKRSDITEAFENARQRLHTATVDTTRAERLLKIVALCEVVSDLSLSTTRPFLHRALNLPPHADRELDDALHMLEQLEALYPPSETGSGTGIYSLPMHGRVNAANLRQRINQRAQSLPAATANHVQALYMPESINAVDYNQRHSSHRKIRAYYVDLGALRSPQRLRGDLGDALNRDALLWYVITSSDAERSEAQSLARELTKQYRQLIVAVPVAPSQVLGALKSYQALENLRKDPELDQAARPFLGDTGQVGKDYKVRLDDEMRKLRDSRQWEWFIRGDAKSGLTPAVITALASKLMEDLFPQTPSTNLGQHFPPDSIKPTLTKAIEQLIKADVRIERTAKGPTESILRTGVVALGLLHPEKTEGAYEVYSVRTPEGRGNLSSSSVWHTMHDHLAAGKPISTLIAELRRTPFGLYDSLLITFLAAFVVHYADSVEVLPSTGSQRPLDIDTPLLKRILDHPKEYFVRFQPLSDQERRWMRGIVERGLGKINFVVPRGTPLRTAVAVQLRNSINRLQLPTFAAGLTKDQLLQTFPKAEPAVIAAVHLLLQSASDENELAARLLRELPHVLGAPEEHRAWSDTSVDQALVLLTEALQALSQLPGLLNEQAVSRIAAIFDAAQVQPENRWSAIYRWRRSRDAVQPASLQTQARTLFRLTDSVRGSVEQLFLDEFARQLIPIGVEYQRWPDLDRLDRLEQEVNRARGEIEAQWQRVASEEEVWLQGLARAASGRELSGVTADQAARHLAAWSTSVVWPACARSLSSLHVQKIYPELAPEECEDVTKLLVRAGYDEQRWRGELLDKLPREFGLQSWQKQEVRATLARFVEATRQASSLEARLRKHVLNRVGGTFAHTIGADQEMPLDEVLTHWQAQNTIPEPNDLSPDATALLAQVGAGAGEYETLFLSRLPRALSGIEQSVQQWAGYDVLDRYESRVQELLHEIGAYDPTSGEEFAWLTGIVRTGLGRELPSPPREKQRLIAIVAQQLGAWLQQQHLPPFAVRLQEAEVCGVFPDTDSIAIRTAVLLVQSSKIVAENAGDFLLRDLPATMGFAERHDTWAEPDLAAALGQLREARYLVEQMPRALRTSLLREVAQVFDGDRPTQLPADLAARVRAWRDAYVILPDDQLTGEARELYDTLSRADDDLEALFLQRLPMRIGEERAPYNQWNTWETKASYIAELNAAAREIAARGKVGPEGGKAAALWKEIRDKLRSLNSDERRWFVKAFRDEFQQ